MTTAPKWDADAVRALSERFDAVAWPPRLDARIHYNTGWPHTSWTGDVCAVVNDEVVVVFSKFPAHAKSGSYKLVHRWEFEDARIPFRYGPIPRALCKRPG